MRDFIIVYNDSLCHFGIGGMKWGKRNGPPYPLSGNAHSASERKSGKKGWTKEAKKEKLKKIGKIAGATATAGGAAALGTIAAKKEIQYQKKNAKDAKELREAIGENTSKGNSFNPASKEGVKLINRVVSGTTQPIAKALRTASKETRSTGIKPASEMSNKELQEFLNRKNLEERYEKYTKETVTTRPGLKTAADALEAIGGLTITALSTVYLVKKIKGKV